MVIRQHRPPFRLERGKWMESTVTLSESGRADSETRTWSTDELFGFTGGVVAFFVDSNGNTLDATPPRSYGVNAKLLSGHDRTAWEVDYFSSDLHNKTAEIKIAFGPNPRDRFWEIARKAKEEFLPWAQAFSRANLK